MSAQTDGNKTAYSMICLFSYDNNNTLVNVNYSIYPIRRMTLNKTVLMKNALNILIALSFYKSKKALRFCYIEHV